MNFSVLAERVMCTVGRNMLDEYAELLTTESSTAWMYDGLMNAQVALENALEISGRQGSDLDLKSALAETERRQSHQLKALYFVLKFTEEQCLAQSPAAHKKAHFWATIRSTLMPEGLMQGAKSYLLQSCEAAVNFASLTDEERRRLSELTLVDGNALLLAQNYVTLGNRLGDLLAKQSAFNSLEGAETLLAEAATQWRQEFTNFFSILPMSSLSQSIQNAMRSPFEGALVQAKEAIAVSESTPEGGEVEGEAALREMAENEFEPMIDEDLDEEDEALWISTLRKSVIEAHLGH